MVINIGYKQFPEFDIWISGFGLVYCRNRGSFLKFLWRNVPGMSLRNRFIIPISNGNRTEWSPIRSVIIRVINKIGRPRSGSPICLSRI